LKLGIDSLNIVSTGAGIESSAVINLFNDIPAFFQKGLLMERDSHGNFPFSQVETEKVLLGLVRDYLNILKEGVMVMADDIKVRHNRLALLDMIAALFGKLADFSKLST